MCVNVRVQARVCCTFFVFFSAEQQECPFFSLIFFSFLFPFFWSQVFASASSGLGGHGPGMFSFFLFSISLVFRLDTLETEESADRRSQVNLCACVCNVALPQ